MVDALYSDEEVLGRINPLVQSLKQEENIEALKAYERAEEWTVIGPLLGDQLAVSFIAIQLVIGAMIPIILLAIVVLYLAVRSVPQGEEWTVERFGRYTRTLPPGLNFIFPFTVLDIKIWFPFLII